MRITCCHRGQEVVRDIPKETVLIGRGPGTGGPDLDLSPDLCVSREHAVLHERHGTLWIKDLGSRLGTRVNGQPIQNQGECQVQPGDVILTGETTLRVELSPAPAPHPVAPVLATAGDAPTFRIEIALNPLDPLEGALGPASSPALHSERRLALLEDLCALFCSAAPPESLLPLTLRRVMEVIPEAERGAVLLGGPNDKELLVKACVSPDGPAVSGTLARRALEEGRGFIWRREPAASCSGSIVDHRIASGIYAPLLWQEEPLGVICVDSSRLAAAFNRDDLRLVMAVAQLTAMALTHRRMPAGASARPARPA